MYRRVSQGLQLEVSGNLRRMQGFGCGVYGLRPSGFRFQVESYIAAGWIYDAVRTKDRRWPSGSLLQDQSALPFWCDRIDASLLLVAHLFFHERPPFLLIGRTPLLT